MMKYFKLLLLTVLIINSTIEDVQGQGCPSSGDFTINTANGTPETQGCKVSFQLVFPDVGDIGAFEITAVNWIIDGEIVSTAQTFQRTFGDNESYSISATIFTDICGNFSASASGTSGVCEPPPPDPFDFEIQAFQLGCEYRFDPVITGDFDEANCEITGHSWDFGDGTPTSGDIYPTHRYAKDSLYGVTLTTNVLCNGDLMTFTSFTTVFVDDVFDGTPTATIDASFGCDEMTMTAVFTPSGCSYNEFLWDFGDGSDELKTDIDTVGHTFPTSQSAYDVTVTALSKTCGCDTKSLPIRINTLNDEQIRVDRSCDLEVSFSHFLSTQNQCNTSYSWNFGDETPAVTGTANPTHSYATPGTYIVSAQVNNTCGCPQSLSRTAVVQRSPEISFINSSTDTCDGQIEFTSQLLGNPDFCTFSPEGDFLWNFGDGITSTDAHPTHQYASAGNYAVSLTVGNSCDCDGAVSTRNLDVEIAEPLAPSTITITSTTETCQDEAFVIFKPTFEASECSITGYHWNFGGGNTSDEESPQFTYTTLGNKTVNLDVDYSCPCDQTGTLSVDPHTVNISTLELVTLNFSNIQFSCTTNFTPELEFVGGQICQFPSYTWDFGDGSPVSTDTKPVHQFPADGLYNVTLTATTNCDGCGPIILTKTLKVNFVDNLPTLEDDPFLFQNETTLKVISASVSTFGSQWPINHLDEDLVDRHPFDNGSNGVWRLERSAAFNTGISERLHTTPNVNLKEDGTYSLENFNWQVADLMEEFTDWEVINTVTNYSPFSFELENRDVLDRHSAALYGYSGQLSTAVGQNMQNEEMAFTSFEQFDDQNQSGNWIFGDDVMDDIPYFQYFFFEITGGFKNFIVVNEPISFFDGINSINVNWRSPERSPFNALVNFRNSVNILCRSAFSENVTFLFLDQQLADRIIDGRGSFITTKPTAPVFSSTETVKHSGRNSLEATSTAFPQPDINIIPEKEYHLSAWASNGNSEALTPDLDASIEIQLVDGSGVVATHTFISSGPMIEGWKQVNGSFTAPTVDTELQITFMGTGPTFFDDLRLFPTDGNMQSFVYDINTQRLLSVLDENNYATYYDYDEEGNLYLVRKETIAGLKTIQESVSYQVEKP